MGLRRLAVILTGAMVAWIPPLSGPLAACTLYGLSEEGLLPEIRQAVAGEIIQNPRRYINGHSRFWSVRDGQGALRGHLYGTFHFPHGAATWLPPAAYAAFAGSRVLVAEVDGRALAETSRDAMRTRQALLAMVQSDPVSTVVDRLVPGLLEPELRRHGITREQADRAGPFVLTRRLNGARCIAAYQAQTSPFVVDLLLQEWALAEGKAIVPLETPDEALAATGVDQPRAEQIQLLAVALRRAQTDDAHIPALVHYYATERIDRAVALGRVYKVDEASGGAVAAHDARLYGRRNALFTEKLDGILRRESGVFAAFGAGHLIGSGGLVARLRDRGWTVEALELR